MFSYSCVDTEHLFQFSLDVLTVFLVFLLQVLCELFQSAPQRGNVPISGNISGFIRRLFLQLMLEDEKVTVFLQSPCPVSIIMADVSSSTLLSYRSRGCVPS